MRGAVSRTLLLLLLLVAPSANAVPATGLADWTVQSDQSSAWMGWSVSSAGFVNDDGYADVVVGVPLWDVSGDDRGTAWIYYGSASGLGGGASLGNGVVGGWRGVSVGGAGDVNGDGFDDVVVGEDQNGVGFGALHVYHGSASGLPASPTYSRTQGLSSRFGFSVDGAGDVDDDGFDDVVVGSVWYSNGENREGRVSVFRGSSGGLLTTAFWNDESNQVGAQHGISVSGAGDVDNDGYDDIVVGADLWTDGEPNEGRAQVYLGGPSGLTTSAAWRVEANVASAFLGTDVAGAGDVNQDGYDDVIVSGYGFNGTAGATVGRAYLYLGGPTATGLTLAPGWPVIGDQGGAALYGVGGVGDVNGDGYPDVAVGALWYDGPEPDEGRVYVYPGSSSGAGTTPIRILEANSATGGVGKDIDGADVNGDGNADVIVGAYAFDSPTTDEGAAFAFMGSDIIPEYSFHPVFDFDGTPFSPGYVVPALNANGDIAFYNASFGNDEIGFVARGKAVEFVASDYDLATNYDYVQLDGLNASGRILFSGIFDAGPPDFFVKTWKSGEGTTDVYAYSSTGGLPTPDLNDAGDVVFLEDPGSGFRLRRFRNGAVEPTPLADCPSPAFQVQTNDAGQIALGCGVGAAARLFLGSAAPFPEVVSPSSFVPPVNGPFRPRGLADDGRLVFDRNDGAAFLRTPTGILSQVPGFYASPSLNDAGTVAITSFAGIDVQSAPAHHVIGVNDPLDGGIAYQISGGDDALNDLGQIAFFARLDSDFGPTGIYLATPVACDSDLDGFCDANDNCPAYPNTDQRDADEDGRGNACDNCPMVANPSQTDTNLDGRGDACPACTPSGPDVPICQDLLVTTPGQAFDVPFEIDALPPRPLLYAYATGTPATLTAQLTLACTGGTPHPSTFFCGTDPLGTTIFENSNDGLILNQVYLCYLEDPDEPGGPVTTADALAGATCSLGVTSQGGTGTLRLVVDSATDGPKAGSKLLAVGGTTTAPTPDEIPFVQEGHDYRFLDAGAGPPTFGVCQFQTPEPTDFMEISYTPAVPGPGWDCCTFQYEGADGLLSEVGQLMVNVSTIPPPPDDDMDGFLDPCDNCLNLPNDQFDGGGVGTTDPDQIGDLCQCGHVFGSGEVNGVDAQRIREYLAGTATFGATELARCSVYGSATECSVRTVAVILRDLAVPERGPLVQQVCTGAL